MKNSFLQKPFRYVYRSVTFWIIGINVFVFFLVNAFGNTTLVNLLPLNSILIITRGTVWQFLTYMFVHADITHLLFNMLALLIFGIQLEKRMGSWEFLLFYLLTGVLAGIFSFFAYLLLGVPAIFLFGASGAVMAVMFGFVMYFPDSVVYLMGLLPIKATLLVILYTGLEIFLQLFSKGGGAAHLTHLAGFGFAFLYFLIRIGINPIDIFKGGRTRFWN